MYMGRSVSCFSHVTGVSVVSVHHFWFINHLPLGELLMDPQKLQTLQSLLSIGNNDLEVAGADLIKAKAVEARTNAATTAQNAGITDAKVLTWIYTGKYS